MKEKELNIYFNFTVQLRNIWNVFDPPERYLPY